MWTQSVTIRSLEPPKSDQPTNPYLDELVRAVNELSAEDYKRLQKRVFRAREPVTTNIAPINRSPERQGIDSLTERENEVLILVASGYSRKEIGGALSISENTAACHIASIYRKLDIRTIAEATHIAIRSGVISPG